MSRPQNTLKVSSSYNKQEKSIVFHVFYYQYHTKIFIFFFFTKKMNENILQTVQK